MSDPSLLNSLDPQPVRSIVFSSSKTPFVLIGDHAGTAIPQSLGDLGLSSRDRSRHIAVDLGVERLGRLLSRSLEAPFIWQAYSRLVIDCNRHPGADDWVPAFSDGSCIAGNANLGERDLAVRKSEIFDPYHDAITQLIDHRDKQGLETILVSLHSFTPHMGGKTRPWEIGILHDGARDEFAKALLGCLQRHDRIVGDNEPYEMDETDYTVPRHAFSRSIPYAEIEVRQDVLETELEALGKLLADTLKTSATAIRNQGS